MRVQKPKNGLEGLPLLLMVSVVIIMISLVIWMGILKSVNGNQLYYINVSPSQISSSTSTITVTAYNKNSMPLPNVKVTLNGTGVHEIGMTNSNGISTFTVTPILVNHQTNGIIYVVATYYSSGIFYSGGVEYAYNEVVVVA